ncbi:hypothetical protein [Prosthecomicrobium sp. N25]|uniref:hypothetical protein n=1 Tax=Prosthecomicrobium sp. N25 TaxID=3129254 RepID=UPI00307870B4
MPIRPAALAFLIVALPGLPAWAGDPYALTPSERYLGAPSVRVRKPETYGPAWHRPKSWPEHRSRGVYVGVPVYPHWRAPAVDFGPDEAYEPDCRWQRVYGPYLNSLGETHVGWHKVPICD